MESHAPPPRHPASGGGGLGGQRCLALIREVPARSGLSDGPPARRARVSCDMSHVPYRVCSSSRRLCCHWHLPFGIWEIPKSPQMLCLSPPGLGNRWSEPPARGLLGREGWSSVTRRLFPLTDEGRRVKPSSRDQPEDP